MADSQEQTSQFNQGADSAALALRQNLQQRGISIPDAAPVEVGPDGQPPRPLPPEGSYLRQQMEAQRAQQAMGQPTPQQQLGDQPVAGTAEQAVDGSMGPPLTQAQPPQEEPVSANAQRRIQDLVAQLREKDTAIAEAQARGNDSEELRTKLAAIQAQHEQLLQSNLENLDPEDRMRVLLNQQVQEQLHGSEQRILAQVLPHIQGLQAQNQKSEMQQLSEKYPGFDMQVHAHLIDSFRAKNRNCTVEQAYLAVSEEPSERVTRESAQVTAVPPVIPPGGTAQMPRYMPTPTDGTRSDPEAELVEEAQRVRQLMQSHDPADHRLGQRLADQNIARRYAHKLPGEPRR